VPLPAPNLDDRRFQELVDEAKRRVQQKCPEWSDHNVSDPGVTMIEIFAWMTEQLGFRLNQVPDRLYVKFLDLLGIELAPPVAAESDVTFWLSAPQPDVVRISPGTQTSTLRTETEPAILFTVTEELAIVPCSLAHLLSSIEEGSFRTHTHELGLEQGIDCFDQVPKPGDALLIGLSDAVPSCAVTLRFDCNVAKGTGVDPHDPPLAWEALDGERWVPCDVGRDDTGGLNRPGEVVLHVPRSHVSSVLEDQRAGWLRCRVVERTDQRIYHESPEIKDLVAFTSGGTARTVNAEIIEGEILGTSNGQPSQRFPLKFGPVIRSEEPVIVEVDGDDEPWEEQRDLADSGPTDRHFVLDTMGSEVVFGPAAREADGSLTYYGAVPPAHSLLRIRAYRTGGGSKGNAAAGAIKMLKTSIPRIARLENRAPARGGTDGEDLESAKRRAPMVFRGTRAVAARDFEHQAMLAAPNEVARALCLAAGDGVDAGSVRVLIVPAVASDDIGTLRFEDVSQLSESLRDKIVEHLRRRTLVGVRVLVEPALYTGITVEATVHAEPKYDPKLIQAAARLALNEYFHPITGGPARDGWPFGRPVHVGEAFWVLQNVPGVLFVQQARLFPSNPQIQQRGEPVERLELEPDALVFPYDHAVEVIFEGAA
jgi:predicted phage baseplate assembly protein